VDRSRVASREAYDPTLDLAIDNRNPDCRTCG
jgi:hypothetical protein